MLRPTEEKRIRRCTAGAALALVCAVLLAAGCSGGGGGTGGDDGGPSGRPSAPASPNPVDLEFRPTALGAPSAPDGRNYRTPEYMGHWGLDAISADEAYKRGYFGQGVTVAVGDDGMDPTHPDLAGRIRVPRHVTNGNADVFEPNLGGRAGEGHGTFVALIAAGARDNAGGPFEIAIAGGASIPTKNAHGVAPRASVMPIQLSGGGSPTAAIEHAADNGAQVLNFSIGVVQHYYGKYAGRDGVWLTVDKPLFRPLLGRDFTDNTRHFPEVFRGIAGTLKDSDLVTVWAAGNSGWNSVVNEVSMCGKNSRDEDGCALGEIHVTAEEFMENFSWLYDENDPSRSVAFRDMWGDCGSEDCADYNSGSAWAAAPLFEAELMGKWLVVGALNRDGEIAPFSNGCGEARNWCLFAPGVGLTVGTDEHGISGTSFAAPMVSGALAVLKSRLPSMPMEVVQALLLVSADPLGARVANPDDPDPVYGWGKLNLGRAVTTQGTVRLPFPVAGTAGTALEVPLRKARIELSPAFARLGERLRDVEVAVAGVGDAYYNMPLSGIVTLEAGAPPALGYAARDLLAPASGYRIESLETSSGTHGAFAELDLDARGVQAVGMDVSSEALGRWRLRYGLCIDCRESAWNEAGGAGSAAAAPFFARAGGTVALEMRGEGVRPFAAAGAGREARGAPWRQVGLRWRRQSGGVVSVAEASRVDESRSVWGARFGALGATRTRTARNRLLFSAPLTGAWRGFAGYERSSAKVSTGSGLLSGISGLRAEGWSAETRGSSVFREGDMVRLSVRRKTGVTGGHATIDHVVAAGNGFADAFYRRLPQSLERKRTAIDLRSHPAMRYALGYGLPLAENMHVAASLEYEVETGDRAASAHLRMSF